MRGASALTVRGSWVVALALPLACTTILGDDFEVVPGGGGGTGGSGAAGGGTGGSGGSTSSGSSGEDCTNGSDDDGDSAVDCEDTDCAPVFSCIPLPPADWSSAHASFHGPGPAAECPQAYPAPTYHGFSALVSDPVECDSCTCTSAAVGCDPAVLAAYFSPNCPSGQAFAVNQNNGCANLPGSSQAVSFSAGAPTAVLNNGCVPSGGEVANTPAPAWQIESRLCAREGPVGAGCEADQVCLPNVQSASFEDTWCIARGGDHECPPPFNEKHLFFDDPGALADTRACTPCECTFSGSCTGITTVHGSNDCSGVPTSVPNNGTCVNTSSAKNTSVVSTSPSGSCPPGGGAPTGDVTPAPNAPKTTICCLP